MGKVSPLKKLFTGILRAAVWLMVIYAVFYRFYFADTTFSETEAVLQTAIIVGVLFTIRTVLLHDVRKNRRRNKDIHSVGEAICTVNHEGYREDILNNGKRTPQTHLRRKSVSERSASSARSAAILIIVAAAAVSAGIIAHRTEQRNEIPESLQEMKDRYPETASFADDYPREGTIRHDMDISTEVTKGEIPLFLQWDKRWGYEKYGSDFLGITGCGPTCLSMVYSGLTGNTDKNPYQMAKYSEESGYYVDGEGSSWNLMTEGVQKLGLHSESLDVSAENIRNALSSGHPVICSMYPGDFTTSGHFIVLAGLDSDGNVIVRDPNSRINSDKSWTIERLLPQIHAMWKYSP